MTLVQEAHRRSIEHTYDDDVLEPVRVTNCATESRVDESGSIACKTAAMWEPGGHFTECAHDHVYKETNGAVGDENGARSSSR